jgi:hypothetical protein
MVEAPTSSDALEQFREAIAPGRPHPLRPRLQVNIPDTSRTSGTAAATRPTEARIPLVLPALMFNVGPGDLHSTLFEHVFE